MCIVLLKLSTNVLANTYIHHLQGLGSPLDVVQSSSPCSQLGGGRLIIVKRIFDLQYTQQASHAVQSHKLTFNGNNKNGLFIWSKRFMANKFL